jgi:hypothetical protein
MTVKYTKWQNMYQHFQFLDLPKYAQIWILGMQKIPSGKRAPKYNTKNVISGQRFTAEETSCKLVEVGRRQGDQIGRIFAHWAIVFWGRFLIIAEVAQIHWLPFSAIQIMYHF